MNAPRLRFNGFAKEWEEKSLGAVIKIKSGKDQKQVECENGLYPILGTGGEIGKTNKFLFDKPSVLIGRKGTIDKPRYMDTPFWTVDTLFYSEVKNSNNAKYIYYLFNTINWLKYNEASGVPSLSRSTIENIVSYVTLILPEQTKIANFLSLIDRKIENQQIKIQILKEYKKGLLQKIFNRELRFKDDNGNDYQDWEEIQIFDLLNYEQPNKYIVSSTEYNNSYNIPVLTANKGFILGYTNETEGIYNKGNVIIFDDFTMDFKYVDFNFKIKSSAIKLLTAKKNNDIKFCAELLSTLNLSPESHARHYISFVQELRVLVPCLPEQQKIASTLSKLDEKISLEEQKLEQLKTYKKGLLQQMFV